MAEFFTELKRRNVIRACTAYIVIAWLTLQVTDVVSDILLLSAWFGQFVLLVLIAGLPVVIVIAWLYELTPDGIKRETLVDGDQAPSKWEGRKLDRLIISVLALALTILVADNYLLPRISQLSKSESTIDLNVIRSVAVLPFVNMSDHPDNDYFSDGLAEELLNVLAKIKNFRVPGRTSSFAFKDKNVDLREIGAKLNVDHILEGSVRQQDDRIRITAQLNDVKTGYHIWSNTYDRELSDIFDLQDEIATEVAKALKETLLLEDTEVISQRPTQNMDAYRHFLRGLHFRDQWTSAGKEKALEEFQKATLLDPEFSGAYAGLAMVYMSMSSFDFMSYTETKTLAKSALDRALELNPDDSWVQIAYGWFSGDREVAISAYGRAIELNPNNARAYIALANALRFVDDAKRILDLHRQAYELDPLSPLVVQQYALRVFNTGDFEKAWRLLDEARELAPDWRGAHRLATTVMLHTGRLDDAFASARREIELDPNEISPLRKMTDILILWRKFDSAQQLIDRIFELNTDDLRAANLQAALYVRQGKPGKALEYRTEFADRVGRDPATLGVIAHLAALAGDMVLAEELIEAYVNVFPETDYTPYLMLRAYILNENGRIDEAARQAQYVISQANDAEAGDLRHRLWPQSRSAMNVVLGHHDAAVKDLRAAFELGYLATSLETSIPEIEMYYSDLADNPEYQALISDINQHIVATRDQYEARTPDQ